MISQLIYLFALAAASTAVTTAQLSLRSMLSNTARAYSRVANRPGQDRSPNDVRAAERAALVELFLATGGPQWTRPDRWLAGDPCDSARPWFGVKCELDDSGRPTVVEM